MIRDLATLIHFFISQLGERTYQSLPSCFSHPFVSVLTFQIETHQHRLLSTNLQLCERKGLMLRLGLFAIPSFAILLGLLIWITLALAVESSMSTVSKYLLVVQHILNKPIVPIQVSIWHFRTSLSMAVWQTQCAYIPREKAAKNIDSPNSIALSGIPRFVHTIAISKARYGTATISIHSHLFRADSQLSEACYI